MGGGHPWSVVTPDLETLLIALYVEIDDHVIPSAGRRAGAPRRLTDAELICLAVAQVLLGARSEHHWLRMCCGRLGHLFPYLPHQPGYHTRLKAAAPLLAVLARPGPADRCDPGAVRHLAKAHGIACVRLVDNAWTYITRHTTATTPPVLTGAYSGYAMTPDGDGDYDFTLLTSSSDNTRSALITPA
jgi:hypothetical protein